MLTRTLAAIAALAVTSPAHADMLSAIDTSPMDYSCDQAAGVYPPNLRNCYLPSFSGSFGPAHSNPAFSIAITLAAPATVMVTYDQMIFLSTSLGPTPAYAAAIGIDSTTTPCELQAGVSLDSSGSMGHDLHAVCMVTLPAGAHRFYALEAARPGARAFHGAVNQLLSVVY